MRDARRGGTLAGMVTGATGPMSRCSISSHGALRTGIAAALSIRTNLPLCVI